MATLPVEAARDEWRPRREPPAPAAADAGTAKHDPPQPLPPPQNQHNDAGLCGAASAFWIGSMCVALVALAAVAAPPPAQAQLNRVARQTLPNTVVAAWDSWVVGGGSDGGGGLAAATCSTLGE